MLHKIIRFAFKVLRLLVLVSDSAYFSIALGKSFDSLSEARGIGGIQLARLKPDSEECGDHRASDYTESSGRSTAGMPSEST